MASRTITVTDAAYVRLAQEKKPGESFTDVILRLTKPRGIPLSELHKHLAPDSAEALAEAYEKNRSAHRDRRARRLSRLGDEER